MGPNEIETNNKTQKANNKEKKIYETLKELDNDILDFLLVCATDFLHRIESGKKLFYFEKQASLTIDTIQKIKKERLYHKQTK